VQTIANKYYHTLNAYGIDLAVEQGKAWYPDAWKYCKFASQYHAVTPERVAAMLAVTSPRARWSKNMAAVAMLLEDMKRPEYKRQKHYGILNANARKGMLVANDRYYSRHVTGPKVTNFYLNILGHTDPVTVDAIMGKAAGFGSDIRVGMRTEIETAVRSLSDVLGITPRDTQAAVWIAYRGSAA
jgi:hypothetical protein